MSGVATAILGTGVVTTIINSRASNKASSNASSALTDSTALQLQMNDASNAAMLAGYSKAADATRYAARESAGAIKYGADQAAESAQAAIDAQMGMYNQTRKDNMPWLTAGKRALATVEKMTNAGPGEFKKSPGYQFRLDQGNKNILGAASATGGLASGRTLKALGEYGQDYASNEYSNFLNQYYQSLTPFQAIAGTGLTSAGTIGNAGNIAGQGMASTYNALGRNQLTAAGQLANVYTNEGNALSSAAMGIAGATASGYNNTADIMSNNMIGQADIANQSTISNANTWTNLLNSGLSAYGMYKGMQPQQSTGGTPWSYNPQATSNYDPTYNQTSLSGNYYQGQMI